MSDRARRFAARKKKAGDKEIYKTHGRRKKEAQIEEENAIRRRFDEYERDPEVIAEHNAEAREDVNKKGKSLVRENKINRAESERSRFKDEFEERGSLFRAKAASDKARREQDSQNEQDALDRAWMDTEKARFEHGRKKAQEFNERVKRGKLNEDQEQQAIEDTLATESARGMGYKKSGDLKRLEDRRAKLDKGLDPDTGRDIKRDAQMDYFINRERGLGPAAAARNKDKLGWAERARLQKGAEARMQGMDDDRNSRSRAAQDAADAERAAEAAAKAAHEKAERYANPAGLMHRKLKT